MRSRLRVGNLGTNIDLSKVKEIFGEFGTVVNAQIMSSELSGQSRGFGFVEMQSEAEANACIEKLNGLEREGQKLMITEAPPEKKRRSATSRAR